MNANGGKYRKKNALMQAQITGRKKNNINVDSRKKRKGNERLYIEG